VRDGVMWTSTGRGPAARRAARARAVPVMAAW
jgi:hypothetical protein